MSSDETYLEAFVESLSTLPHEARRNLELMKDLDQSCSARSDHLRKLQQEYINNAEDKMMQLELVEQERQGDDGGHDIGVRVLHGDAVIIPTTKELMSYIHDGENKEKYAEIKQLQTDCLQQAEEKVSIARQAYEMIDATVQRLDKDIVSMEQLLQTTGQFQDGNNVTAKPGELAAIKLTQSSEWILAKVVSYDLSTGMYKLADEDVESNKIWHLPESQVVVLASVEKLAKGDVIWAVYPDTTSFYQATVVQAPRKGYCLVNFLDDSDEYGVTHDKAVPVNHVTSLLN